MCSLQVAISDETQIWRRCGGGPSESFVIVPGTKSIQVNESLCQSNAWTAFRN
jgi:hypothetical protein